MMIHRQLLCSFLTLVLIKSTIKFQPCLTRDWLPPLHPFPVFLILTPLLPSFHHSIANIIRNNQVHTNILPLRIYCPKKPNEEVWTYGRTEPRRPPPLVVAATHCTKPGSWGVVLVDFERQLMFSHIFCLWHGQLLLLKELALTFCALRSQWT